jgi:general secretion pathway protein E
MAIEASLTGHFVLSTIHTNDACSAPNRLIDMGVQPFLIASSLAAVVAQRLIQTLCNDCKQPTEYSEKELAQLAITDIPKDAKFFKAVGCPKCNFRGYDSRTTVCELLTITDEIRPLIMEKSDSNKLKKLAIKQGMRTLRQDAMRKVFEGITSVEEMSRVINEEEDRLEQ